MRARGETHARARLTEADVRSIRAAYASRERPTLAELAAQYGVTFGHISSIVTRRTWRHVKGSDDDQSARELLAVLAHAHSVLDERDRERGTLTTSSARGRHVPRHHPTWHQECL